MTDGALAFERLTLSAIATVHLIAGEQRWIAPGTRWRVPALDAGTRFDFATFADETRAADAAQPARSALLHDLPPRRWRDATNPTEALTALAPGTAQLIHAHGPAGARLTNVLQAGAGACSWHPLQQDADGTTVVVVRPNPPGTLADYMGRDHAVIEAALAGALAGDADCARWLPRVLARHLAIEERVLFPAYLAVGGQARWIDGLLREHRDLRQHLPRLADPVSRRRFLLMLDGHDEKEEQLIYPDVMARLGARCDSIASRCMTYPLVA